MINWIFVKVLKMFIVEKQKYKRQYWDWYINTESTVEKVLIEIGQVWVWKTWLFIHNKFYEIHAFIVSVLYKLKFSGCWWNTRGAEFRKENQLLTKRIMALHLLVLSFFMDNINNLNVCQKLGKNSLLILGFLLNLFLPKPSPCPFPKYMEKIKSIRN